MGFMDKVKSTTTQLVGSGQAKLDSVQAKRQADDLFRHLGLLVYNERQGRAPADQATQVDSALSKLQELEAQHPQVFVPQAGVGDPTAVGAMAPAAGTFIPTAAGNVGESTLDVDAGAGQPMGAPAFAPQPVGGIPQPAPGFPPPPGGDIPQAVPGIPQAAPFDPMAAPQGVPQGGGFIPTAAEPPPAGAFGAPTGEAAEAGEGEEPGAGA